MASCLLYSIEILLPSRTPVEYLATSRYNSAISSRTNEGTKVEQLKIGVIGFRGEPVDLQEAKETLALAFNTIERDFPNAKFAVLFDGLNLGVSTIAAPLAGARRWHTHSIFRIFDRVDWDKYGPVDAGGTACQI